MGSKKKTCRCFECLWQKGMCCVPNCREPKPENEKLPVCWVAKLSRAWCPAEQQPMETMLWKSRQYGSIKPGQYHHASDLTTLPHCSILRLKFLRGTIEFIRILLISMYDRKILSETVFYYFHELITANEPFVLCSFTKPIFLFSLAGRRRGFIFFSMRI